MREAILDVRNLSKSFGRSGLWQPQRVIRAVDDVSFSMASGEVLGIVGESGSGKSTVARLLLRLVEPDRGDIIYRGVDLRGLSYSEMRRMRRELQIVFQDPFASLNPRASVGWAITETLRFHGIGTPAQREKRARYLLDLVGLSQSYFHRRPHELSGGQSQRIGIARALIIEPKLLILDESVSALDVSVQSQILDLLQNMKERFNLSYIFVSHNLTVVRRMSDRIVVFYLGRIMEIVSSRALKGDGAALHPYTESLLEAVLVSDPRVQRVSDLRQVKGEIPSSLDQTQGCRFKGRCRYAMSICMRHEPELTEVSPGHFMACFLHRGPEQVAAQSAASAPSA